MIEVKVNDKAVTATLDRLLKAAGDLRPALTDIGEYLIMSTKQRFAAQRDPDGNPWERNRPVTIARKGRDQPGVGESKRLSREIHYRVENGRLLVGSALEYAAVFHYGAKKGAFGRTRRGGPIPWGDIPARKILGVSDEDQTQVLDILAEHLEAALP